MPHTTNPVGRKTDIIIQEFGDEVFIYDLKTHKVSSLNETSTLIWRLCDGNHSVDEIAKKVGKNVDADLVRIALDQLNRESLLDGGSEPEMHFTAKTRREVIKRIGFASMVALPVVASLVAPGAIHAQSAAFSCPNCVPDGGTVSGTFPGLADSQACVANLTNCCCIMLAAAGGCSCNQQGTCTGSITCSACIATGGTSAGTFPGLNDSQICVSNLAAACCSLMASAGGCTCNQAGDCSGSITCA